MNSLNCLLNKTNRFVFILTIFTLSVAFISSCNKDILEKESLDSFSDDQVWKDGKLVEAYINNIYKIMPNGHLNDRYRIYWGFMGLCDEGSSRENPENDDNNAGNINPSAIGAYEGAYEYWTDYYAVIKKCNDVLDRIDASPIEESLKNRMKGEATFLRAYSYFRLTALHGGVPLIIKPFKITDDFNVPRNTYDECMNFVVAQLDIAAGLLPLEYTGKELGRVTKGAALSYKSRALLYMASPLNNPSNNLSKWQAAADAAKAVIDLNKYSLYSNYQNIFLAAYEYNSEVIWSRPFNNQILRESLVELYYYPNGYGGYGHIFPLHNLVDAYETLNGLLPSEDPSYDSQNPYVNRDPRFYMTILYDGAPFKSREVETFFPGGKDSNESAFSPWNATETGYYLRKFLDESITNPNNKDRNGNSPFIYCRYAEILLNYAEAKYFLGDEVTCSEYINMIRSRTGVNMPPVTASGAALLEKLYHERQIELACEEHRWFDVRRWKTAPVVLSEPGKRISIIKDLNTGVKTYTVIDFKTSRKFYDKNYLVPIPQSEIDKNPLLEQNPDY